MTARPPIAEVMPDAPEEIRLWAFYETRAQGRAAARAGESESANPYLNGGRGIGTVAWAGWDTGHFGEVYRMQHPPQQTLF